jgi:hypothetical protein
MKLSGERLTRLSSYGIFFGDICFSFQRLVKGDAFAQIEIRSTSSSVISSPVRS